MPEPDKGVFVEGEKVVLREKTIEDAADDYEWRVDDELASLDATRPLNMSYKDFLKYTGDELALPNPRSKRLAIDTADGKHIGNCMYYDIDIRKGETEIGIMIDREYWNKGYGTDALDALLGHIFTSTPLTRAYLHTLEWNYRARRAFTKAGLHEVEKVRRSGQDFILMEISRSEWEQHRHSQPQPGDETDSGKPRSEAEPTAGQTPT